jgi:hypothetical protein
VWLGLEDIKQFLKQLHAVFNSRNGVATLHSMSRDEFSLEIKPLNVGGH